MAKFLSSDKIKVFPTAFRGKDANSKAIDPNAFLTTEQNFANITNKVTYLFKNYYFTDGDTIHLILGGYYFVFNKSQVTSQFTNPQNNDEIYAAIKVQNLTTSYESFECKTLTPNGGAAGDILDVESNGVQEFKGLSLLLNPTTQELNSYDFTLSLFGYKDGWANSISSQLNISTEQIRDGAGSKQPLSTHFTTSGITTKSMTIGGNINASASNNSYRIGSASSPFKSMYARNLFVSNITTSDELSIGATNITISVENLLAYSAFNIAVSASGYYSINTEAFNISASTLTASTLSSIVLSAGKAVRLGGSAVDLSTNSAAFNMSSNALTLGVMGVSTDYAAVNVASDAIALSIFTHRGEASFVMDSNIKYTKNGQQVAFDLDTNDMAKLTYSGGIGSNPKFLSISGFDDIYLNTRRIHVDDGWDYPIRPYEHRMVITLMSSDTQIGRIVLNPKLYTISCISTVSAFMSAMAAAQYYTSMISGGNELNSPVVATGRFPNTSGIFYSVEGLGIGGTLSIASSWDIYCFAGAQDMPFSCVNLSGYTLSIKDFVYGSNYN